MFGALTPGFLHIPAPNPYRFDGDIQPGETVGHAAARALEEAILREGPESVAAFIAEPIQGVGGVIVPPDDYFEQVRAICDKYEVLLILDEVICGFGRTGKLVWSAAMGRCAPTSCPSPRASPAATCRWVASRFRMRSAR
jgi:putrescine aminotransferase